MSISASCCPENVWRNRFCSLLYLAFPPYFSSMYVFSCRYLPGQRSLSRQHVRLRMRGYVPPKSAVGVEEPQSFSAAFPASRLGMSMLLRKTFSAEVTWRTPATSLLTFFVVVSFVPCYLSCPLFLFQLKVAISSCLGYINQGTKSCPLKGPLKCDNQ